MTSLIRHLPMGWAARLALLRLSAQWRSLLTIMVGVLLAAVIGANAPLYTAAVAQFGMVQRIAQQPAQNTNLFTRISLSAQDVDDLSTRLDDLDGQMRELTAQSLVPFPGWLNEIILWGESGTLFVVRDGVDVPSIKLSLAHYDHWESHVTLVEGEIPTDVPPEEIDVEGVLPAGVAAALDVHVGDTFVLDQRGWDTSVPFTVRVAAIVTETDPDAPYFMSPSPLRAIPAPNGSLEANVLVSRETLLRAARDYVPQVRSLFGWRFLFNPQALSYNEIPRAAEAISTLNTAMIERVEDELNLPFFSQTQLPAILTSYHGEVGVLSAPIGLLLVQIGALVLFFLVVTVALVRRGERREVAMLQSRGAFDTQIVWVRAVESLVICAIAALLAPFFARAVLIWAAPLVAGVDELPLTLDATPFLYAAGAAVLAMVVLVATLRPVLRLPLIMAGGSSVRSEKQSWWQKYYLDVVLLVIGAVALLRLVGSNSAFTNTVLGGAQADPLLLLAPAIMFVALGSISLRLFPAFAEAAARIYGERRGLEGALATWQVSREPAHYGRVTFMLALAIGVGWFATSFQATVARSQVDQAHYSVGADVRWVERDSEQNIERALSSEAYTALSGVESATVARRYDDINLSLSNTAIERGTLLAVDPAAFREAANWREDLGTIALPVLSDGVTVTAAVGEALPFTPQRISLWIRGEGLSTVTPVFDAEATAEPTAEPTPETTPAVQPDEPQGFQPDPALFDVFPMVNYTLGHLNFALRVRDSEGNTAQIGLTPVEMEGVAPEITFQDTLLDFSEMPTSNANDADAEYERVRQARTGATGWLRYEAEIPETLIGEIRVEAILFTARELTQFEAEFMRLDPVPNTPTRLVTFADLALINADGDSIPTELMNATWELVEGSGVGSGFFQTEPMPDARGGGHQVLFSQFQDTDAYGLVVNYPSNAIPAVTSRAYAEANNLLVGANFDLFVDRQRMTFQLVGTADYFPTLYGDQAPFVVADLASLIYMRNRSMANPIYPSEVWVNLQDGVSADAFLDEQRAQASTEGRLIESAQTVDEALNTLQTDPLSLGLLGLLYVAFIVAMLLSVVSLLTYMALTAQARRGEFAVLRAMGLPPGRLVLSLAGEQVIVFLTAILLGAVLGFVLSRQVLPSLAVSTTGQAITPPFLVQVETSALAQYGVILFVVLTVVLVLSLVLVRRLSLSQALRYGEE